MAAVMLATYPEMFAGGAIIAGLPYGRRRNVQEALDSMFQGRSLPAAAWGDSCARASPQRALAEDLDLARQRRSRRCCRRMPTNW